MKTDLQISGLMNKDRTWAEVNLSALLHNFRYAQATKKRVMCVLKANAYGHGALVCGKFLEQNGADAFAVASLEEGIQLRCGGITLPILVLGYVPPEKIPLLIEHGLTPSVTSEKHAVLLNRAACDCNKTLTVHVKVDTGMSRLGIAAGVGTDIQEAAAVVMRICGLSNLDVEGLYTHYAAANMPSGRDFTLLQYLRFSDIIKILTNEDMRPRLCHISNSPGILYHGHTCIDMVRAGSLLYGMYPDGIPNESGILRPVMTLKAKIAQIQNLAQGATVSYGRTFSCKTDMRVAVVMAGYADGYPRQLSNVGYDTVSGMRCSTLGVVCMDLHCIDAGYLPENAVGMEAVLWGKGGMSLERAAGLSGMANCEITCTVGKRVPRIYIID